MKVEIIEKKVETILRPTGINLAPYVVNPYQGCAFSCLFCYAQFSKAAQKEERKWGEYVKVKVNGLEILEKELNINTPDRVLIGSTTEPFQPVEKQYGITRGIIRVLNQRKIKYVIMSRSMLLEEFIEELDKKLCDSVYFTVDAMPESIKRKLQPYVVSSEASISLVNQLNAKGINAIAYFCPVMPFLYNSLRDLKCLNPGVKAEFEIVNFQMAGMKKLIGMIEQISPETAKNYRKMCRDQLFYENVMKDIKNDIRRISKERDDDVIIHTHVYAEYFKNIY